jgi:hypothetical protein
VAKMKSLAKKWKSPAVAMSAATLAVVLIAVILGMLNLRTSPDTAGYVDASRQSLLEMLRYSHVLFYPRTVGYPLVLKAVALFSPSFAWVPFLQLWAQVAAAWGLFFAVQVYGFEGAEAAFWGIGTLLAVLNDRWVSYLLTDSLARSCGVAAVACLFWVSARPRRWLGWLSLGACVAATYQLRPAYLFMLPLALMLGLFLFYMQGKRAPAAKQMAGQAGRLAFWAFVPFLAFCALRLFLAGQFQLVPMGGYNVMGFSAELLTPASVAALPAELQPLANAMMAKRHQLGLDQGKPSYVKWRNDFTANINDVAVPAAREVCGDHPETINARLSALSKALILSHARTYLAFLIFNFAACMGGLVEDGRVLIAVMLLGLPLFFLRLLKERGMGGTFTGAADAKRHNVGQRWRGLTIGLVVAASYALAGTLIVTVGGIEEPRYTSAAGVFLPCVLFYVVAGEWSRIKAAGPLWTLGGAGKGR